MNVALIPVRGDSKSIPLKNIKYLYGKPLVYWTVKAACECKYIDAVYISTDNIKIKETVEKFQDELLNSEKIHVIGRSAETATDTAPTESVMLEFANKYDFDNIVLIQATSPMLTGDDLNGGFALFQNEGTDSVLSVVRQYRFLWEQDDSGYVEPLNYDVYHRPRRQDFDGYLMENGAFYITSKEALIKSQNRVSGNIKAYEMREDSAYELDEPSDWTIVEELMKKNGMNKGDNAIPEIKMLLTDCDGCLTDAGMYYSEMGDEMKKFNTRDGMGISLLKESGIISGMITSESVKLNERRAQKLKLDVLVEGCKDKATAVQTISKEWQIPLENIAYIGDDVNDIDVIRMVGFGVCPSDAVQTVKEVSDYITQAKGGAGVIREVADLILEQ